MSNLIVQNLANCNINVPENVTILKALQQTGIDWMHACGAKGRCTTCRIIVLEGMENISALSAAEVRFRDLGRLKLNERLTCQCTLTGDVCGRVPEQTKLPHMSYTN
ncbi:MAG: (2Fe-2S)-binding protein [Hymenobacteraceae bacterium]|nr:(2Fe-2S)-binding protein [Hymenobacteraceae bacterium]